MIPSTEEVQMPPVNMLGRGGCSEQSRAEKSEGFLRSFPQQFTLASQKKGLPSPNKPSGLKMILIHRVVELAPIKT